MDASCSTGACPHSTAGYQQSARHRRYRAPILSVGRAESMSGAVTQRVTGRGEESEGGVPANHLAKADKAERRMAWRQISYCTSARVAGAEVTSAPEFLAVHFKESIAATGAEIGRQWRMAHDKMWCGKWGLVGDE